MITDRERLNWMVRREAYATEYDAVPRWGVFTSQACLEEIGRGNTPRAAIDDAMQAEEGGSPKGAKQ